MKRIIGLALAVAALTAGCGSADKNEYVTSVNNAQASLTTSLSKINPAGKPEQIATELDEGGAAIEATVKDFKAIEPPEDAAKAHGQIVSGLSALATTFHDAAEAARAKDTEKMATCSAASRPPRVRSSSKPRRRSWWPMATSSRTAERRR